MLNGNSKSNNSCNSKYIWEAVIIVNNIEVIIKRDIYYEQKRSGIQI